LGFPPGKGRIEVHVGNEEYAHSVIAKQRP
jgi:hypothetical protein